MYYIGIDVAKQLHTAAIKDEQGNQIGQVIEFKNNEQGFSSLLEHFKQHNILPDECIVIMESTGHYWMNLHEFLDTHDFPISVINPLRTDSFRNVDSIRKTKTDKIDAVLIADFGRLAKTDITTLPSELTASLKEIARYRADFVRKRTMQKNKATAQCDKLFPELAEVIGGVNCKAARAVMRQFQTPQAVASTDIRTLTKILKSASQGHFGRKHAEALKEAAKTSIGTTYASEASAFVLRKAIETIDFYDAQISELEKQIKELMKDTSVEYLTTIPGIGEVSACTIAGEIGCPENFEDASKLVAFAGLDPRTKQSGDFESTNNHISKRGSAYLRYALITSANVAREYDSYFGDYYDSLRARGKHHFVALAAVARKLAGVVLAIMKEKRKYEPRPSIQSLQQSKKVAS